MKKKKLKSLPTIRRRLLKLACDKAREKANNKCEFCGMKKGDLYNGKPQRVEAHHIMSKSNKNSPLKYDLRNLVCLCSNHHKFSSFSAHKHGLWFAEQFKKLKPNDYEWILNHSCDEVDLNDRAVLEIIEQCLRKNLPLDLQIYGVTYIKSGKYLHETFCIQDHKPIEQ